jgi:hypothetical protein
MSDKTNDSGVNKDYRSPEFRKLIDCENGCAANIQESVNGNIGSPEENMRYRYQCMAECKFIYDVARATAVNNSKTG